MDSRRKRLAIVAGLSLSLAVLDCVWFFFASSAIELHMNETIVAQAERVGGDALQRPPTRILWQQIQAGDSLYNGQTIRTGQDGEIRIQFSDGRSIDIEPGSIISLTRQEKEINLELLGGSVKVSKVQGASDSNLTVNTANGKVDLTDANATISNGPDARVNLMVLDGKANITATDGKQSEVTSGQASAITKAQVEVLTPLTITSPTLGKAFYLIAENTSSLVPISWRGARNNLRTKVLAGTLRGELRPLQVEGKYKDTGFSVKLPPGKHWLQVVAEDPKTGKVVQESGIERLEVIKAYPPNLVYPTAETDLEINSNSDQLNFEWSSAAEVKSIKLEVASDSNFQQQVLSQTFDPGLNHFQLPLKAGVYYVRLSALYPDLDKAIPNRIIRFRMVQKEPAQLAWKVPTEKRTQLFGQKPELELQWESKSRQKEISRFVLKVQKTENGSGSPIEISTSKNSTKIELPAAGRYIASVDAYDEQGNKIGISEQLELNSVEAPLLPAPKLAATAEGNLQSSADGKMQLRWEGIKGAAFYRIVVTRSNGELLLDQKSDSPSMNLKNLMPGSYTAVVEAIDNYGRKSEAGIARKILVPDKSNIAAPTLKRITVE